MPGTAMHHMIIERLKGFIEQNQALGNIDPADYQKLQDLLGDKKNWPYLFLGSQGPDFLFFNTKDWNPAVGSVANIYLDVSDFIADFKKQLLALVPQPVLDALAALSEAGEEVVESSSTLTEITELFSDINNVLTGLLAALKEKGKEFVLGQINPFDDLLTHPYRDGVDPANPDEWWYFDALHYRKTAQYSKALLNSTKAFDAPTALYALGFLSHVGADTVGHAYVNINSGGPYRAQPQRHRVAENFQDVFNYFLSASAPEKDINRSKLHALYNFNFDGSPDPDEDSRMPDDLADLISANVNATYQVDEDGSNGPDFGPNLTADDVKAAYRFWYRWWKGTTESSIIPRPVPYSFSGEVREVFEQATENMEDIGDFLEDAVDSTSDLGILSILAMLIALAIAAVMVALTIVDMILGLITTLSVATIRALACLIYEEVYNAYQQFRLAVSLTGLAYPMSEHINEPVMQQFTDPSQRDSTGANAATFVTAMPLPRWTPQEAEVFPEKHLIYPPTRTSPSGEVHGERRHLLSAPFSYYNQHASFYGWGDIRLSPEIIDQLYDLQESPPGSVDVEARTSEILIQGKLALGNGVTLTGELYNRWRTDRPIPDFNLDSDRGYAYLCWVQVDDQNQPNTPTRLVVQPPEGASSGEVTDALEAEIKLQYLPSGA